LAHTGAGETGIIAGLAAVLMAAGAGITIAARRNRDDREESIADLTT
jgi:LPXTG-motif cell wall-anchored protein